MPPTLATAAAWGWRLLILGTVLWIALRWLSGLTLVTVPLALSLLLAALLQRPAVALRRWLPRWLAGLLVLLAALAVVGAVVYFLVVRVQGQYDRLISQAEVVLAQFRADFVGVGGLGSGSTSVIDRVTTWLQAHDSAVLNEALSAGTILARVLTGAVLTLFLTLFFLIDGDRIWSWCIRLLPQRTRPVANGAGHRAFQVLSGWVSGTAIIALIHGVVIGATLELLGAPLVIVLAVLVFIGSFIPVVGAFVFGGLACLVTLVTVGVGPALVLFGVLLVENLLEGHVYQPLIMGRTVQLHPITVLLAITIGSELDGVFGAIIAVPLAAAVHAAVKYATGLEDIEGHPLRDEDRMAPEQPPLSARSATGAR